MLEQYVIKNNKKLRMGYTTGSCAAAAAKAAARQLLFGKSVSYVDLMTPKGIPLHLEVLNAACGEGWASCAIQKDGGDDPDATHGLLVYAKVSVSETPDIRIDGGAGVGRVTKPGLEQPVGAAAINRVPRQMIREAVEEELTRAAQEAAEEKAAEGGAEKRQIPPGLQVEISIPGGEMAAEKTFNSRLGIVGGLSVLGTSGIVEPMSEEALIASIRVDIRMQLAGGKEYLILVPGNYGMDFLTGTRAELLSESVKCSNFIGEALDAAVEYGARGVLLLGHIGKFVKLAAGIMNTHSRNADGRMEILTAHAALCGADLPVCRRLMECVTTDDALEVLEQAGLLKAVMDRLMERMEFYVNHRCYGKLELGVLTFSQQQGVLGKTKLVESLFEKLEVQRKRCGQQS